MTQSTHSVPTGIPCVFASNCYESLRESPKDASTKQFLVSLETCGLTVLSGQLDLIKMRPVLRSHLMNMGMSPPHPVRCHLGPHLWVCPLRTAYTVIRAQGHLMLLCGIAFISKARKTALQVQTALKAETT